MKNKDKNIELFTSENIEKITKKNSSLIDEEGEKSIEETQNALKNVINELDKLNEESDPDE